MAKNKSATTDAVQSPEELENTAALAAAGLENPVFDDSDFEAEHVGYAPYWNPMPERFFVGIVQSIDDRDPDFVRYNLVSQLDGLVCATGPKEDAERVVVNKGEFFSVSKYDGLPLEEYLGVPVLVKALKKVETKNGREVWKWSLKLPSAVKGAIMKERQKNTILGRAAEVRALPEPKSEPQLANGTAVRAQA